METHADDRAVRPLHADETITITMTNADQSGDLQEQLKPCCDNFRTCQPGVSPFAISGGGVITGYHLIVDGTLRYASDYVPRMIQAVERSKRLAIIGVGGWLVMKPRGLFEIRQADPVARDMPVHLLDMRTIAYHAHSAVKELHKTRCPFSYRGLGVWAQESQVSMISTRRTGMWVWQRANTEGSPLPDEDPAVLLGKVNDWGLYKARKSNA